MDSPFQIHPQYQKLEYDKIGQYGNYLALRDIANAVRYGFADCRLPKPGKEIDVKEAEKHVDKIEAEWKQEWVIRARSSRWSSAPNLVGLPLGAKLYLHSIIDQNPTMDYLDEYPI